MQQAFAEEERRTHFIADVESHAQERGGWLRGCGLVLFCAFVIGAATALFLLVEPNKNTVTVCVSVIVLVICITVAWLISICVTTDRD